MTAAQSESLTIALAFGRRDFLPRWQQCTEPPVVGLGLVPAEEFWEVLHVNLSTVLLRLLQLKDLDSVGLKLLFAQETSASSVYQIHLLRVSSKSAAVVSLRGD